GPAGGGDNLARAPAGGNLDPLAARDSRAGGDAPDLLDGGRDGLGRNGQDEQIRSGGGEVVGDAAGRGNLDVGQLTAAAGLAEVLYGRATAEQGDLVSIVAQKGGAHDGHLAGAEDADRFRHGL